nr:uncharacterized protein LOC106678297 isoform X1 [Halyomorpha halys]
MKFLSTVLFLCAFAFLQLIAARRYYGDRYIRNLYGYDHYWGHRTINDSILYESRIIHRGKNVRLNLPRHLIHRENYNHKDTVEIHHPPRGFSSAGLITYMEAQNYGRYPGSATITSGGVGYHNVSLHLEADYWKDVYIIIRVYGIRRSSENC